MPNIEALTKINLDDLIESFGWQCHPILSRAARRCFVGPARAFAAQMVEFDAQIAEVGLPEAARLAQQHYVHDVHVVREAPLPDGPVLALANHPGLADALSLFSALNRDDLRVIALDRPFLTSLPHISERLFYVRRETAAARTHLVREVSRHLRHGGAVLTFPAGHIEPDPDLQRDAMDSLRTWTDSVGVFVRMAPDAAVVPVLVRGVLWDKIASHWSLHVRRTRADRERLAATFQLLANVVWHARPVTVNIRIGRPITAAALGTTAPQAIHDAVLREMRRLHALDTTGGALSPSLQAHGHDLSEAITKTPRAAAGRSPA